MGLQLAILVAAVLVGLAGAIALAHAGPWPAARAPSNAAVVRVQRSVRRYGVLLGVIEVAALIALLIVLFSVPARSAEMWLVGVAAICVAFMIGVWTALLRPLNATIVEWAPESLPDDWTRHHARWTTYHRIRLVLAIIALTLLLIGLFARPAA
jgi:uncharacterized membrane protein